MTATTLPASHASSLNGTNEPPRERHCSRSSGRAQAKMNAMERIVANSWACREPHSHTGSTVTVCTQVCRYGKTCVACRGNSGISCEPQARRVGGFWIVSKGCGLGPTQFGFQVLSFPFSTFITQADSFTDIAGYFDLFRGLAYGFLPQSLIRLSTFYVSFENCDDFFDYAFFRSSRLEINQQIVHRSILHQTIHHEGHVLSPALRSCCANRIRCHSTRLSSPCCQHPERPSRYERRLR